MKEFNSVIIRFILLLFFLLCFIDFSFQQEQQLCSPNCDIRGVCQENGCFCYFGYFPDTSDISIYKTNCRSNPQQDSPQFWLFQRVFFSICFLLVLFTSLLGFFWTNFNQKNYDASVLRTRKITLLICSLAALFRILFWFIDPFSFNSILPWLLSTHFYYLYFPTLVSGYFSVLFYWIEIYDFAIQSLKRLEMIQKINANYDKEVTVEEVVEKVNFLRKLKIPFILVCIFLFLVQIGYIIAIYFTNRVYIIVPVWAFAFGLVLVFLAILSFIYGKKLVKLMPPQAKRNVKKESIYMFSVMLTTAIAVFVFSGLTSAFAGKINGFMITFFLVSIIEFCILFALLSVHMKFSKKFPFIFKARYKKNNSSNSKDSNSTNYHSNNKHQTIELSDDLDNKNEGQSTSKKTEETSIVKENEKSSEKQRTDSKEEKLETEESQEEN